MWKTSPAADLLDLPRSTLLHGVGYINVKQQCIICNRYCMFRNINPINNIYISVSLLNKNSLGRSVVSRTRGKSVHTGWKGIRNKINVPTRNKV